MQNSIIFCMRIVVLISLCFPFLFCNNYHSNTGYPQTDSVIVQNPDGSIMRAEKWSYIQKIDSLRIKEAIEELKRGNIIFKVERNIIGKRLQEVFLKDFGVIIDETDEIEKGVYNKIILHRFFSMYNEMQIFESIHKSLQYESMLPRYMNIDSTYNLYISNCINYKPEQLIDCNDNIISNIQNIIYDIDICNIKSTDKKIIIQAVIDSNGFVRNPQLIYKLCPIIDNQVINLIDTVRPHYKPATLNNKKICIKVQWTYSWDRMVLVDDCN